ncbi:glycosyltransferase family 4 protein [Natrarchaeobius oligotrophus]|uniref:Glycosyltransferase family 1 protein n=1 Tax=Natrarchaeobius chitinivorans TaxID=1679083 RepID=A0A3N6M981_NATCH|nr:glycosyltransferase family 4 protein [Natrarchaeobius chitinivorans]RQH00249.1 glycosyltransferase family 1 protein [Natrarchaeobius chitinivorans]
MNAGTKGATAHRAQPTSTVSSSDERPEATEPESVLIVADHPNPSKIERHYGPLADVASETTMVCLTPNESVDSIAYRTVPTLGWRPLGILLLFVAALVEGVRNEYDAIVSISLIPYGCYALLLRPFVGARAHLGIIGADLDVHAVAWYGPLVRVAFRRFDSLSVPGTVHRRQLREMGVDGDRIGILSNAIDTERYAPPERSVESRYDFLWIGRFSEEKDPLLFVAALAVLADRGLEFRAAMLGSGDERDAVERALASSGLADCVDLPGWVDDPREYYYESDAFVLTSSRDALPLTLLEAMATGSACVVSRVGSVPDVARHRETALVVEGRTPAAFADALEELVTDDRLRERLAGNATAVGDEYSYAAARDDWRRMLETLRGGADSHRNDTGRRQRDVETASSDGRANRGD